MAVHSSSAYVLFSDVATCAFFALAGAIAGSLAQTAIGRQTSIASAAQKTNPSLAIVGLQDGVIHRIRGTGDPILNSLVGQFTLEQERFPDLRRLHWPAQTTID